MQRLSKANPAIPICSSNTMGHEHSSKWFMWVHFLEIEFLSSWPSVSKPLVIIIITKAIATTSRIATQKPLPLQATPEHHQVPAAISNIKGLLKSAPFSAMLVEPLASGVHFTICACHPDNWVTGHANSLSIVSSANWRPDYLQAYTWVHWLNCDTKAMERCKRICIASKGLQQASDNIQRQGTHQPRSFGKKC